jgi:hypothetical protein
MPGSYAANLKEGSRSEILADYLFSQWGAVTPVRRQDDVGVDLYCTLCDRVGAEAVVREYFVVQVKSGTGPWVFKNKDSVKWLIQYPIPLFLACVDKKRASVSVYHVMPRFLVWALGYLPNRLVLRPKKTVKGKFVKWENGTDFSLSAPIIRATCTDLANGRVMKTLASVFQRWVGFDRENCDLLRQGLLRFRMPSAYSVNEIPNTGIGEMGLALPEPQFIERGILKLAESAECIGGQLFRRGDRAGTLRAALLVDHLRKSYGHILTKHPRWTGTIPGDLGMLVCPAINEAAGYGDNPPSMYRGLSDIGKMLESNPVVERFLADSQGGEPKAQSQSRAATPA